MSSSNALPLPIEHLYRGCARNPDGIAAQDPEGLIRYRELQIRVEALALALLDRLAPGSHVGLCAGNHIDHLVAHLAIIAARLVWIPINPSNGPSLNAALVASSDMQLLLVDSHNRTATANSAVEQLALDAQTGEDCRNLIACYRGRSFERQLPDPAATMAIKFTGGTTGQPKGVLQSHANVAAVIANMQAVYQFRQEDANLAVAPLSHGGSHYILPLLSVGARHILLPNADTDVMVKALAHQGASVSFMPPTLIYKLLQQLETTPHRFSRLRQLTYSAAPMPPERIAQCLERLGPCLSTVYGQTEAPMTITALNTREMCREELRGSVGRACIHSEVAIVDTDGQALSAGQTGEIAVRGALVSPGYYRAPGATSATFRDGWLRTGDLGYLDANGYLFLQGRSVELIISGGFNIYPAEVENALVGLAGIDEAVAFGVADNYWGQRLEAAVCLAPGTTLQGDTIRALAKPLLGPVKTPKAIHILPALPRNPVGKVVRREVQALVYPR
ncbi:class I adenylate-forming enzyme family protein [Microbulbifer spongiae]|uniref:AMP-binding protein n=1 Tax=Microbulbifer spongiae TaxID=2944933 RepID=A0ABY9EER5_9GAMM|nr:AMP-binding protein [Microbulbifer sp. MI-G]WKD51518.1 AMP-binding protein [Microbulbifer sp. MI-G]